MAGMKKDIEQLLRRLAKEGCEVSLASGRGNHWKVTRPGCRSVTVSYSPSDSHALRNVKADVRRNFGIVL